MAYHRRLGHDQHECKQRFRCRYAKLSLLPKGVSSTRAATNLNFKSPTPLTDSAEMRGADGPTESKIKGPRIVSYGARLTST